MSGLESLYNLLEKRSNFPCVNSAHEFVSSLKSENDRLSLATNGLVPLLENGDIKISLRILAGYLLYAIYNFTNTPNPFYDRLVKLYKIQCIQSLPASDALFQTNINAHQERTQFGFEEWHTNRVTREESFLFPPVEGDASPFERVLWKLLKGEGDELAPYPATTLADVHFWMPEKYQPSSGNNVNTLSNAHRSLPSPMLASSSHNDPYRTIPTPLSSTLSPHQPTISHIHTSPGGNNLLPDNIISVNYRPLGHASGYGSVNAIAPPTAHKSMVAPNSSRPSPRPSPITHPLQLSPSSVSASSTLESSSIQTPLSFVDSSAFSLPNKESTRQVDASTFRIPEVNRWSTPADIPLSTKNDLKHSPLPRLHDRHTSPALPPKSLQPIRNPGVIGSGRPSSTSPSEPSSERSAESRASYIGIVGNHTSSSAGHMTGRGSLLYNTEDKDNRQHSLLAPRLASPFATASFPSYRRPAGSSVITQAPPPTEQQGVRAAPLMSATSLRNVTQDVAGTTHKDMKPVQRTLISGHSAIEDEVAADREPDNQNRYPETSFPSHDQSSQHQEVNSQMGNTPDLDAIRERNELTDAIVLYLMARERVLTLQEQKKLGPHLSMLTRPICILRPEDIPSLVANNQDIAVKLLFYLFNQDDKDSRKIEELLKNVHLNEEHNAGLGSDSADSLSLVSKMVKLINNYGGGLSRTAGTSDDFSLSSPLGGPHAMRGYLVALAELPPTLQSFSVLGKLLMPNPNQSGQSEDDSKRIATLIRTEVLGAFISGCIRWIERVDRDEKEGNVHDDRVATATGNLCRFYTSLIRNGIIAANSEEDTTEMMSFALRFSRFDTAQRLYSILVAART